MPSVSASGNGSCRAADGGMPNGFAHERDATSHAVPLGYAAPISRNGVDTIDEVAVRAAIAENPPSQGNGPASRSPHFALIWPV